MSFLWRETLKADSAFAYLSHLRSSGEAPQRKRCRSSNYKQQIYSGQSPQIGWSFVKAEQRKMLLHNRGVLSELLDELLTRLCWNNYSPEKQQQKKTFSHKRQR